MADGGFVVFNALTAFNIEQTINDISDCFITEAVSVCLSSIFICMLQLTTEEQKLEQKCYRIASFSEILILHHCYFAFNICPFFAL